MGIVANENVLNADGTLNGTIAHKWMPISASCRYHRATFDGNGYTIFGLYSNNSDMDYVGMFGCVGLYGKVQNLGVADAFFTGCNYAGSLAGYSQGIITNCNTSSLSSAISTLAV